MPTQIQLRRGTTSEHSSFTGAAGEVTVDTTKKTVVVHDGATAGGMALLPKTMTDGTANGVAYLNGSKVLTTGSALTFDGTNLGVGTSSPGSKLHIDGNFIRIEQSGANKGYVGNAADLITGAPAGLGIRFDGSALRFAASSTQIAMFDTSGNLGLGVTPSAWSQGRAMEFINPGYGLWNGSGSPASMYMLANAYFNGGFKYGGTGQASHYYQYQGAHVWSTAASGTAGNAISFTQAMTLDASGNLLVGTTSSDGSRLRVYGAYQTFGDGAYEGLIGKASSLVSGGGAGDFAIRSAANLVFATNGNTERARITSGGDFGIGTSAGTGKRTLTVQSNTSGDAQLDLVCGGADVGSLWFERSTLRLYARASNTGGVYLASGGTSWTAVSDERKKDIIEPISDAANKVSTLRAVIGKYKTDDEGKRRSFLIAQDVQAVLPEAVDASNPDELGLSYSDIIPLLVASIQELKAEFDAYKATHP